ncbi:hypothetical protein H6P81_006750 [Aristolochia fimbriata]|uniref:Uncharacterized protein n=1 Tax=Aristolochia fimbriata TaxID=158543 RepID=A0AAV7EZE9_ARIFI|nr:hypothetical protein H6P81_006750 [Aristolochia fimbriata]
MNSSKTSQQSNAKSNNGERSSHTEKRLPHKEEDEITEGRESPGSRRCRLANLNKVDAESKVDAECEVDAGSELNVVHESMPEAKSMAEVEIEARENNNRRAEHRNGVVP